MYIRDVAMCVHYTLCGMGQKPNLIEHVTVFNYRQSFTNTIIKETIRVK